MPRRREFLAALPVAAAAPAEDDAETIYVPDRHRESDRQFLTGFLRDFSFAMVITTHGGLRISNVPTLYEEAEGSWGSVWWHLAKGNAQNGALGEAGETTIVFRGPHSYISPNWYETKNAVPTWNFCVVHATGKARRIDDDAAFARQLEKLVGTNEAKYAAGERRWRLADLPESYLRGMRQGIVAYQMRIEGVEAKFKLGQERNAPDREGVLAALRAGKGREAGIFEVTQKYYALRSVK
jgi:transcriptional regulator